MNVELHTSVLYCRKNIQMFVDGEIDLLMLLLGSVFNDQTVSVFASC